MQNNRFKSAVLGVKDKLTAKNEQGRYKLFDSLFFYAVISLLMTVIIELLSRSSLIGTLKFIALDPYAFFFNALIIFFTYTLVFFIPKRVFMLILVTVFWTGLGLTDFILLQKRVTPFIPADLTLVTSVFQIFPVYLSTFEIVLIVLLALAVLAGLVLLAIKLGSYRVLWKKGALALIFTAAALALSFNFGILTTALSTDFYNLNIAYDDYGFAYCFSVSLFDNGIKKPKNYSEEAIGKILERIDNGNNNEVKDSPNIIFVQLESFFDVNYLKNYTYSENPVPFFEELKKDGISGWLTVPVIGAGTVNTEFEVLSGMSLKCFGAGQYPYKTVLLKGTCESVPYNLSELGYRTHAIHNYIGTFYDRNKVYPNLGFETFTSMEYMNGLEFNEGNWPCDSILPGEIIDTLKSTPERDFIMAVGVQGHGKYPPYSLRGKYQSRIKTEYSGDADKAEKTDLEAMSYFVDQMKETDLFIKELIYRVKKFDEDCVVVFYGDHLPSLSLSDDDLKEGTVFSTEYVIVSNYGLEKNVSEDPDLASYQLAAKVLQYLGINNGAMTKLHQKFMDSPDYYEMMNDLEYDMFYGERYMYGGKNKFYPQAAMKMGIRDIKVTGYTLENGILTVSGENFTPYSRIAVNGEMYKNTDFVSVGTLSIAYSGNIESISVVQYSDTDVILSRTESISFD